MSIGWSRKPFEIFRGGLYQAAKATGDISHRIDDPQSRISDATNAIQQLKPPITVLTEMTTRVKTGAEGQNVATGEIAEAIGVASRGAGDADAAIAEAREASAQHGQTARNIAQIAETLSNRVNDLTTHVDSLDERLKA